MKKPHLSGAQKPGRPWMAVDQLRRPRPPVSFMQWRAIRLPARNQAKAPRRNRRPEAAGEFGPTGFGDTGRQVGCRFVASGGAIWDQCPPCRVNRQADREDRDQPDRGASRPRGAGYSVRRRGPVRANGSVRAESHGLPLQGPTGSPPGKAGRPAKGIQKRLGEIAAC